MEKKYELTDTTINVDGRILHRIEALRDFSDVKAGELGGWIEKEENLSHAGNAWVGDEACVYDNATVRLNACVYDRAKVYDNADIRDHAEVFDNAKIYGNAKVYGCAQVYCSAKVHGRAYISGYAEVFNYAEVFDDAKVVGEACVYDEAKVCDHAVVCGNAKVCSDADYIVFRNFWSSGRYFTWSRSNNMWRVGCFRGTGEELIKKAYADSERSGREYERVVRYVESILADEKEENEQQ